MLARDSELGLQLNTGYFRTAPQVIADINDLDLASLHREIENQLDVFNQRGSGWNLLHIKQFIIHYVKFNPLVGSSYISTPDCIKRKRAVINVQNSDNQCFMWSILSCLKPTSHHPEHISKYIPFTKAADFTSLKYPVTLTQIREFERLNTDLTVNVYVHSKDNDIIPVYLTKHKARPKHIDLLLLIDNEKSH
jgi:hypothetical protein